MAAGLTLGRLEADLVAVEARRHLETGPMPRVAAVPLPAAARLAERPAPTLTGYDDLLTGTNP